MLSPMYTRPSHRPRHEDDVVEVMRNYPFATLVTGTIASHLPFVFENGTLYAHMARANPHSNVLASESLVIFVGPHGYISPSWYSAAARATAPTWNYVAVHCYGTPRIHDATEAERNIQRLIANVESGSNAWQLSELERADVDRMIANIVSFEIHPTRIEGKFKLSQGDQPERIQAAIQHTDPALAAYLRRYNE
jgi:transcriptional regulator